MALLRPDVWPANDLALAIAVTGSEATKNTPESSDELQTMAEAWRPYRSVAARMFWQYYLARQKAARERRDSVVELMSTWKSMTAEVTGRDGHREVGSPRARFPSSTQSVDRRRRSDHSSRDRPEVVPPPKCRARESCECVRSPCAIQAHQPRRQQSPSSSSTKSRVGTSFCFPKSIILPSRPQRTARHLFS